MNRFSGDVNTVDTTLPSAFSGFSGTVLRVIATMIVQAIVFPELLAAMVPLALVYLAVQHFYRPASRELKRLDSITKSPVYAHLSETLSGLSTIAAYGLASSFVKVSQARTDTNAVVYLKMNLINRWLGLRLDWVGAVLVGVTALVAVLTAGNINPSLVGLALSYAISILGLLNWVVRQATETETMLSCVERIEAYASLPVEALPIVPGNRPPAAWPSAGAITIRNLTVGYREGLPPVLRDLSLDIPAGCRVGVCGRTGSGKSSLMLALFRILEPREGSIVIDGIDIGGIGLDDLRSRLAIIPQVRQQLVAYAVSQSHSHFTAAVSRSTALPVLSTFVLVLLCSPLCRPAAAGACPLRGIAAVQPGPCRHTAGRRAVECAAGSADGALRQGRVDRAEGR